MNHPRSAYFPVSSKQQDQISKNAKILQFESILQQQRNAIKDLLKKHNNKSTASQKQKQILISQRSVANTQSQIKTPQLYLQQSIPSTRLSLSMRPNTKQLKTHNDKSAIPICPQIDAEEAKYLQYLKSSEYKNYLKKITKEAISQKDVVTQMKQTRNHNIYLKKSEFVKKNYEEEPKTSQRLQYPCKQSKNITKQINKQTQKISSNIQTNLYHRTNKKQRLILNKNNNRLQNQKNNHLQTNNNNINNIVTPKNSYTYLQQKLKQLQKQQVQTPIIKKQKIKLKEASTQTTFNNPDNQKIIIQSKVIEHYKHDPIPKQNQTKTKLTQQNCQFAQKTPLYKPQSLYKSKSITKLPSKEQIISKMFIHCENKQYQNKKTDSNYFNLKTNPKQKIVKKNNILSQLSFLKQEEDKQNYKYYEQSKKYSDCLGSGNYQFDKNVNIYEIDFKLTPPCKKKDCYQRSSNQKRNINSDKRWQKQSQTTSVVTKSTQKPLSSIKQPLKAKVNSKLSLITPSRLNK